MWFGNLLDSILLLYHVVKFHIFYIEKSLQKFLKWQFYLLWFPRYHSHMTLWATCWPPSVKIRFCGLLPFFVGEVSRPQIDWNWAFFAQYIHVVKMAAMSNGTNDVVIWVLVGLESHQPAYCMLGIFRHWKLRMCTSKLGFMLDGQFHALLQL